MDPNIGADDNLSERKSNGNILTRHGCVPAIRIHRAECQSCTRRDAYNFRRIRFHRMIGRSFFAKHPGMDYFAINGFCNIENIKKAGKPC